MSDRHRRQRQPRPRSATFDGDVSDADDLAQRLQAARLEAFLNRAASAKAPMRDDLDDLILRTAQLYSHSVSESTREAYVRRWRLFEQWCGRSGLASLPAAPETVMLYFSDAVRERGASLSTLRTWVAAINRIHVEAGHPAPGRDPAMTMFLRGLSRSVPAGRPPDPVSALRVGELRQICRCLDAQAVDARAIRDRALLALHRAGMNDSEVSRLSWEDAAWDDRCVRITVASVRSGGSPRVIRLVRQRDPSRCGFDAVRCWREIAGDLPPMFGLLAGGRRLPEPLDSREVGRIRRSRLDSLASGRGQAATVEKAIGLLARRPSLVLRDKALLLLGFAGAFRRNEVTDLQWGDVKPGPGGLIVFLRRSKTDRMGRGAYVGIPTGQSRLTCPVTALEEWRARCRDQVGRLDDDRPCFVHVGRAGRVGSEPISPEGLTRLVQRRAGEAGLPGHWGGRSLRAGFISTAADLGIPLEAIARQSRHATLDSLVLYIRSDDPFRGNAASRLGM